jgi:hypothetical protein
MMEEKHYALGGGENNRLVRVFQVIFGVLCIGIAVYWLIYNFKSVKSDGTLWITVAFLIGFGGYLIWAGLGFSYRFIEFGSDRITLKKNSLLPAKVIKASSVEKIVVFPLKFIIFLKPSGRILNRFGVNNTENIEPVKDHLLKFAEENGIEHEIMNEG